MEARADRDSGKSLVRGRDLSPPAEVIEGRSWTSAPEMYNLSWSHDQAPDCVGGRVMPIMMVKGGKPE
ncbi:hypothetical protein PGTUg99_004113 [Puccinia graminis f. sp. tritici]|uniref:Uncharacterized protein n=1 Tax=Puccinia graminis f. sp. tritici TaxID=56615 RepID=A0A5B0M3U6_PUCGR|nr:hypothetical protein PGTUg99_004113 [Puccinia graminis f. sp. tritici]